MLILNRRVGETLFVGDDTTVTVLGIKGNQVRVGVTAPTNVEVHREEIYYRAHPDRVPEHKRKWMEQMSGGADETLTPVVTTKRRRG